MCITAVLALGEIARVSLENEREIIAILCERYSATYPPASLSGMLGKGNSDGMHGYSRVVVVIRNAIGCVLEYVAQSFRYPSLRTFLESHLRYVIGQWEERKLSLSSFPYRLLECSGRIEWSTSPRTRVTCSHSLYCR